MSTTGHRLRAELRAIAELSLPMMIAQGGIMAMGVVDTMFVGRVSSLEMAAVALGNSVAGMIIVLGIGLAMGIEPLVSQALGAGDALSGRRWLWQGLYLAAIVSVPLCLVTIAVTQMFDRFGIPEDIGSRATVYIYSRVPGILFNCTFAALRAYCTSIGKARPVLITVVAANVLNVILDWALIFGHLGMPAMGSVGAGLATSIAWAFMTVMLAYAVRLDPVHEAAGVPVRAGSGGWIHSADNRLARPAPSFEDMAKIARIGWPIALQISVEVGIFTLVSALIARFGAVALAGHQIALTMASFSFMGAVGIANAASARVGFHIGAGSTPMARRAGFLCIVIGALFMGACGAVYALDALRISALFAPADVPAQMMGAELLVIAAVFAVSDGIQVVAAGALRGAGDTKWPFYANLAAHWVVALPIALYLGHERGLGPIGYWWALSAGLTGVASILLARFFVLTRREVARVV